MKRLVTIVFLLALMPGLAYAFPEQTNSATVTIGANTGHSFRQWRFKLEGFSDQDFRFTTTVDYSSYSAAFKIARTVGTGQVAYVALSGSQITVGTNEISFDLSRTNVPPNGTYSSEIWLYDSTTNNARTLGRGTIQVTDSLYDDSDSTFPFPNPTNLTDYIAKTAFTVAEGVTNSWNSSTVTLTLRTNYAATGGHIAVLPGTGITVTTSGVNRTVAATLGVAIDSSEITDGTITDADFDVDRVRTTGDTMTGDLVLNDNDIYADQVTLTNGALSGLTAKLVTADDCQFNDTVQILAILDMGNTGVVRNVANITPTTSNLYDMGSSALWWNEIFVTDIKAGADAIGDAEVSDAITVSAGGSVANGALDADLQTWAGVTPSANGQAVVTGTYANMKALLNLEIGTDVQAWDANLDQLASPLNFAIQYTDILGAYNSYVWTNSGFWYGPGGGAIPIQTLNGAPLTNLAADNIASGFLNNARLDTDLQTLAAPTPWSLYHVNGSTWSRLKLGTTGQVLKA